MKSDKQFLKKNVLQLDGGTDRQMGKGTDGQALLFSPIPGVMVMFWLRHKFEEERKIFENHKKFQ